MNFFDSIISFLSTIFTYLLNIIETMMTLLMLLAQMMNIPYYLYGQVVPLIGSCILFVIAIGAVKLLIGRSNG